MDDARLEVVKALMWMIGDCGTLNERGAHDLDVYCNGYGSWLIPAQRPSSTAPLRSEEVLARVDAFLAERA